MAWFVGVDVGGTFTDFYARRREDGAVRVFKRPSTPRNPGEAIVLGLREMCTALAVDSADITRLCHGTTVATNALIQRRGGKVAMVTTDGFRDLLEIGRQTRPHMYSLQKDHPAPLVPRERRHEVIERIGPDGGVITALDENSLAAAVDAVVAGEPDACAICCLFSFVDPAHESKIAAALRARRPDLPVSLSSEVWPEFREYERFSTTVLNAYLQPVIGDYIDYLDAEMKAVAPDAPIRIYQSNGGLMSVETARTYPVRTALSGPAAGAVGAVHNARLAQKSNVITLDMGGTSADVALIRNYDPGVSPGGDVAGFPVRLPMVHIHTVGAGGGSIAWFERDGLLKVGPRSAGSDPGPACYGRGGTEPTVTDANLVLGRLSAGGLVGGTMALDEATARDAIAPIAMRLRVSIEKAAQGILGIVVANMVRAVRTISVKRGLDPKDYALLPFGGAGPLHAVEVARALGMSDVVVPDTPGILCAQGLIVSDIKEEFVRSRRLALDAANWAAISEVLEDLERDARAWFEGEDVVFDSQSLSVSLDARYVGQNFELPVVLTAANPREWQRPSAIAEIERAFHAEHERRYGFHNAVEPIEVVNIRVTAAGRMEEGATGPEHPAGSTETATPIARRPVWFQDDDPVDTPVYQRADLASGASLIGPAVIDQFDSTAIVFPDDELIVDDAGNLAISVNAKHLAGRQAA